jgi:two-component system response regulator DevR
VDNSSCIPLNILVVAKDPLIQQGAVALLRAQPGWFVQTPLQPQRITQLHHLTVKPDIALIAIVDLDDMAMHCIAQLKQAEVRVVVYGAVPNSDSVRNVIAAGADTFVEIGASVERIITAIEACATGRHLVITSNETQQLLWEVNRVQTYASFIQPALTNREQDLLHYISQGLTNSQIADCLQIKVGTVNSHVTRILHKYGLSRRSQLALLTNTQSPSTYHLL